MVETPGSGGIARLKRGVSFGEARLDLESISQALQEEYTENRAVLPRPHPMQQRITEDVRGSLWLLMGAVALVLLIAAANVGSLMLARGTGRVRELAIRGALGAGRSRLIRQLLVESLVLALLGGALGLVLAGVAMRVLEAHRPAWLPDHVALALNLRVLLFNLGASCVCALLFGLLPAVMGSRTQLRAMRQGDARDVGRPARWPRPDGGGAVAAAVRVRVGGGRVRGGGGGPSHKLSVCSIHPEMRRVTLISSEAVEVYKISHISTQVV